MNFRDDINGLRAIALLGVILFHFSSSSLPGGFAGVDVFFVISGFLMTSIIIKGLQGNKFSLIDFYIARARRIVPALAVLCLILVAAGWFYLHPSDLNSLAKHALGSVSFLSNFVYLAESGYFDEASKEKWLLHTWSLSVEWQFYILYPIALMVLYKLIGFRWLRYCLVLGTIGSFLLCVYATSRWPSASFFLLPTRAWEMLVGGLAFLYPLRLSGWARKCTEVLGMVLILLAYMGLSEAVSWPGRWAALPVAGALLVIVAHAERSWITGSAPVQWLGTISYSVYLWHWPIAVWLNYSGNGGGQQWVAFGMVLSLGLGALSYSLVEKRTNSRASKGSAVGRMKPTLVNLFLSSVLVSAVVFYKDGFQSRLSPEYVEITAQQVMPRRNNGYCFYDFNGGVELEVSRDAMGCKLGARNLPAKVLLFGDSYAGHYEPFWDELGKLHGISIHAISTNWCTPISGDHFDGPISHPAYQQCRLHRQALAESARDYDLVIFAGQWSSGLRGGYLDDMMSTIRRTAGTVPTVIVKPPPTRYDTNVLKRFQRNLFHDVPFDMQKFSKAADEHEQDAYGRLRKGAEDVGNVIFVNREQLFAPSDTYEKLGRAVPYSLDGMHITLEGSLIAAQNFQNTDLYRQVVHALLAGVARRTDR